MCLAILIDVCIVRFIGDPGLEMLMGSVIVAIIIGLSLAGRLKVLEAASGLPSGP